MPREDDVPVQQSVLDRLMGTDDLAGEATTRSQGVRELKAAVRRDLEGLLNTRSIAVPPPEILTAVSNSIYAFGLGDITSLSADDPKSAALLRRMIQRAIASFEPRLRAVQIDEVSPSGERSRLVRLVIHAVLDMDPSPERISFDTVLDLSTGQLEVKGESGAG
jgi:type VI secretion system protein ImpF